MELSEKKYELVKTAIENSEKFNSELHDFDAVQKKVIKKSSFILSSLSDDSLISKYLKKVVDDVLIEFALDAQNEELEKSLIPNYSDKASDSIKIDETEPLDVLPKEENTDSSDFSKEDYQAENTEAEEQITLDEVVDKVVEIKETEFENKNSDQNITPDTLITDGVFENGFDFNSDEPDEILIVPEIDSDIEVEPQPVFDLPKDEFPTSDPEILYNDIEDPIVHKEVKTVPQETTDKILGILIEATKTPETKDYIKIFYLKYIKKMKQVEIAKMLDMSETELSETYFAMVKYVKSKLY